MKKVMIIINPTSGGETALDYKENLESKTKEYFLPKTPLKKNMMQ